MSEGLTSEDFTTFFKDVHGYEPFPWQQRLTEYVLNCGSWPKVIDLPTGTGKTAVLDTAAFALAARPKISPRRVIFVIDRRIVVDQVYRRAQVIRDKIKSGNTRILQRVRDSLVRLSGGEPLGVVALRGGIPIDNAWTHHADQPWVMVSTVDQFGSRLLFRGYGVTPSMWPVHAGLAGNDCLVILDEVHLSVPFAETLEQVSTLEPGKLPRRFIVVEMSATPSDSEAERFKLDPPSDLHQCEELARRVHASKEAELVTVRNHDAIPKAVLKIVKSIAELKTSNHVRSVGVILNRVRTARETYHALEEFGYAAYLVTGRMRPLDRVEALDNIGPMVDPDGEQRPAELTTVVATQAIEVGADFSFDALITECAPVDSLRQRFGRLDRRGTFFTRTSTAAKAWIIGPKTVVASKRPDPIYGHSTKVTWEELERRRQEGPIEVGANSLADFPDEAIATRDQAPLLLTTHMDRWTQTNPEPLVQPSVEWFLHGLYQARAQDVSIVWREDRSGEVLRLVPPRHAEYLPVPIDAAKSWLSYDIEVDVADVELGVADDRDYIAASDENADWVRWAGFDVGPENVSIGDIRPGDVLVVDPIRGGLTAGTWDASSAEPVADLGDAAQIEYGRRATLRLQSSLLNQTPPAIPNDESSEVASARERINAWLDQQREEPGEQPRWFAKAIKRLTDRDFEITAVDGADGNTGAGYYVLTERHSGTRKPVVDAATMDGSDDAGSLTGTGVTLSRHLYGVGDLASKTAERLGLSADIAGDLRLAGWLHDIGKVDRRFQLQLVGGDLVDFEMQEEPLAKSLQGARRVRRYPPGMRHEVASVAMIESNPTVLNRATDKDLVLHLIGTHHGWGRPLPPIIQDAEPETLSYSFDEHSLLVSSDLSEGPLALDMADRFWRLVDRYGYYGLAWLETILRLADHRQSEKEATQP